MHLHCKVSRYLRARVCGSVKSRHRASTLKSIRMGLLLAVLVPVTFCIGIWLVCAHRSRRTAKRPMTTDSVPQIYRDIDTCEWVMEGFDMTEDVGNSFRKPLRSRAIPNQRLVRAFGIDNAFTTTDAEYYRLFRRSVELLLKINEERWKHLAHTATELALSGLRHSPVIDNRREVSLVPLLQKMVLKFSMHILFSLPVDELDDDAIAIIAQKINCLWISSKNSQLTKSMHSDQRDLREALHKIFPQAGETARENPLNLILPAYETMWRVVLRCFLEVGFRRHNDGQGFRPILGKFLADPSRATFETTTPKAGGISAASIVDEALRLYPPTRRIYRQQSSVARGPSLVAADIEYLHQDPGVWGKDSSLFKPSRWVGVGKDSRRAFLPFGSKPFACPAKNDAGPRMIGVLVAALLAVFNQDWECIAVHPEDRIDGDAPLSLGRGCYETLMLKEALA